MIKEYINNIMIKEYFDSIKQIADLISNNEIEWVAEAIYDAGKRKSAVYVIGNGGSASTASHFVCDLKKATNNKLNIIGLTDSIPVITACGNDFGYDKIFVYQLENSLRQGDIVIAFSGSGMSPNVLKAIEYANSLNAVTIGITGYNGGELKKISRLGIHVPINDMQISEDFHLIITHIIMKKIKSQVW